jgi:hypothetical protein
MAKISGKNIELKDSERIIFGTNDSAFIEWDETNNQLEVSTVISGVDPTQDGHLTTKRYVDQIIGIQSGYPVYYIEEGIHIQVPNWGQYVIHDIGYLEIEGTLELGEGSMIIIQGVN